jgi:hypothetical protein
MGRKVPFRCSVRLHHRLLRPFSDSLRREILRSSPRRSPGVIIQASSDPSGKRVEKEESPCR